MAMLVMLAVTFVVSTAHAAPFCAVRPAGKQCLYYDLQKCLQAAGEGGECVVNAREVLLPDRFVQNTPYCVVASAFGAQCIYRDESSCLRAASQAKGACVSNRSGSPKIVTRLPDPEGREKKLVKSPPDIDAGREAATLPDGNRKKSK